LLKEKKSIFEIKNPTFPPIKQTNKVVNFIKNDNLIIKEKGKINQFNIDPPTTAKNINPNILFFIIKPPSLKQFIED